MWYLVNFSHDRGKYINKENSYVDSFPFFLDSKFMKRSLWQAALLIAVSIGGNISEVLTHPQLVLAQSNRNLKKEAAQVYESSLQEYRKGNLQGSLDLLQKARSLFKASGSRSGEANTLNGLGTVYLKIGQYPQAIDYFQQALKIARELGDRDQEGIILGNLGEFYNELGQYQKAIDYGKQALNIARQIKNRSMEGKSLHSLGVTHYHLEEYEKAIEYYQQSLLISKERKDLVSESNTLNTLGGAYIGLGRYTKAIDYLEQALKIRRGLGNRLGEGTTLNSLGGLHYKLGQYSKSIEYFEQSLKITQAVGNSSGESAVLYNLGRINSIINRLSTAENYLQKSIAISDELRINLTDRDKISLFEQQSNGYKALSLVQQRQRKFAESLIASERGRARAFQDLLAQKQNLPKPTTPDFIQLQAIAQRDRSTIVEYNIIPTDIKDDPRSQEEMLIYVITPDGKLTVRTQPLPRSLSVFVGNNPDGELVVSTDSFNNLDRLVTSNRDTINADRNASRGQNTNPRSPLQIGQAVRIKGDNLNIRSRKIVRIDLPNKMVEVTGLSSEVGSDLVRIDQIIPLAHAENTRYASLQQLHKLLIDPIADLLPKNADDSVVFIPDGALFEVPFAALQDEKGKYLIDKHTVLTAPSLGVLAQTSKIIPQGKEAAIFGNPTMPKPRKIYGETKLLQPLPFSEIEANQVASLYRTTALVGAEATETAVKSQLTQYRVIHLSTHGILNQKLVGESAIVLAAGGGNDGYLTVDEILDLKLNADLVVLSACDTGRGDIKGDGVVGLSRALMTAGTRSLIVSLWSVDDRSTSELMQEFYRQWRPGTKSKAVALRAAMLAVREQYPAPYHWAGMTLMGESK
jgi:CHAT domain-containing protein/lipopolysaccharide biosynthesis regulator YciM